MAERPDVTLTAEVQLSRDTQSRLQTEFSRLEKNLRFSAPFGGINKDLGDFSNQMARANQRVITLGASFAALAGATRALKEIVTSAIDVEAAFTDINAVFKLGIQDMDRFGKGLFDVARNTSQSFDKVAEAAKEFSRQGLTATETLKRTNDAMILVRLASLDTTEAVQTLTAAVNGFQKSGLNTGQIVAKLATVDAAFAVSAKDLAQGLARAGASASDAGVSFDQLIGLITSAQQTTARGGAIIGNALKTIFTRLERADTIDAFKALGVAIEDTQGNLLPTIQLLQNFAKTYDTLTGSVKSGAAQLVGGVYQINQLKAVLGDLSKANSVYSQATGISAAASNEAIKRNEALNQSYSALLQNFLTTNKQIAANVGNNTFLGPVKGLLKSSIDNPITRALEDASGQAETTGGKIAQAVMEGFGASIIYGLGPILLKALVNVGAGTFKNVVKDTAQAAGLSGGATENAAIQEQIVALYKAGGTELQQQIALMTTLGEKAAFVRNLLMEQSAATAATQAEIAAIAGISQGAGYRPRGGAAGGYIPFAEESAAIAAGVGGASPGARPVYLSDFNLGNGQRGIVANTSEWRVPHAAGGESIYNPAMVQKYGLPPGARPIAAGGYIPNAAGGGVPPEWSSPDYYKWMRPVYPFGVSPGTPYAQGNGGGGASATGQGFGQYTDPFSGAQGNLERAFEKLAKDVSGAMLKAASTINANATIAGFGPVIQNGPPSPSASALALSNVLVTRSGGSKMDPANALYYQNLSFKGRNTPEGDWGGTGTGGVLSGRDTDRIRSVYRQQMVEERQAERQDEIIAQNKRIDALRKRLTANVKYDPYDPSFVGPRAPIGYEFNSPRTVDTSTFSGTPYLGQPSLLSRVGTGLKGAFSKAFTGPNAGLTAAFVLPALGALTPQGAGGTGAGVGLGALGGALTGGGFGASIGSVLPGIGSGIGLLVGTVVGGLVGAMKKSEQSFEELARTISESDAKIQKQISFVQSAFNAQDAVINALRSGSPEGRVNDLRRERTQAILGIQDSGIRKQVISRINDPNGPSDITDLLLADKRKNSLSNDLNSVVRRTLDASNLKGFAGYDDQAHNDIGSVLRQAAGGMSKDQLAVVGRENGIDPVAAFRNILKTAGVGDKTVASLTSRSNSATTELFREAISKMIHDLVDDGILQLDENYKAAEMAAKRFQQSIQDLGAEFTLQSKSVQIHAAANANTARTAQQIMLGSGTLTQEEIIAGQGSFTGFNIREDIRNRKLSESFSGRAALISSLGSQAKGVDSERLRDRLKGLNGLSDFEKLKSDLGTIEGRKGLPAVATDAFNAALNKIIDSLKELDISLDANTKANDESTDALVEDYRFKGTRAGAADQYVGTSRQANVDLTRAINRNDPIDIQRQAATNATAADLQRMLQAGTITQPEADRILAGGNLGNQADKAARDRAAIISLSRSGSTNVSGSDVASALFGNAQQSGREGKSGTSLLGGFHAVFEGLKKDISDLSDLGKNAADSLNSNLGNAFGEFVTGVKNGKDAFRDFTISVLSDLSRMLATKAISGLLGSLFGGFGAANGGRIGYAGGGKVPAMVMGGEYYFGPQAAQRIGYDTLNRMNRYAGGGAVDHGLIRGGSGVKDDLPAQLPRGSFIVRQSAVRKLGPDYLNALGSGQVQHRDIGGILLGAILGGGAGYLAGGKKGAIGGAILGGIGGGLYSYNSSSQALATSPGAALVGPTLSTAAKLAIGLGAAGGLGLLASGVSDRPSNGPINYSQIPAYAQSLQAQQAAAISGAGGKVPYLSIGPQGQSYIAGYGDQVATRKWADGGAVLDMASTPMSSGPSSGGSGGAQVSIKIDINNAGNAVSSSANGGSGLSDGAVSKLEKLVKGWTQEELVNQSRNDGFFAQKSRFINSH